MEKLSTFFLSFVLTITVIIGTSCSGTDTKKSRMGRCKYNCSDKWDEAQKICKKKRGIDKELCLKHTYWKLNDWI